MNKKLMIAEAILKKLNKPLEIEDIEFELKGRSLNEKLKEFFGKNK